MPNVCPNILSKEWKFLEKSIGNRGAYKVFIANGERVPNMKQATELAKAYALKVNNPIQLDVFNPNKVQDEVGKRMFTTKDVLNDHFKLVNYSGGKRRVNNGYEIANWINNNIANIEAFVFRDGNAGQVVDLRYRDNVINYTIDDNYENLGELLLNDGEFDDTFDEDARKERFNSLSRFGDLITNRNSQIRQLTQKMSIANADNNIAEAERLRKEIENIKEEIDYITEAVRIEDLYRIAEKDLRKAEDLLDDPNLSLKQLYLTRKSMNIWENAIDLFFTDDEIQSDVLKKEFQQYSNYASLLLRKITRIEKDFIHRLIKEQTGEEVDITKVFAVQRDVSKGVSHLRDISMVDNLMFQAIHKVVNKQHLQVGRELQDIKETIDELAKNITSYDDFKEKWADGTLTGNLISPMSPEYSETKSNMYRTAFNNNTRKDWDNLYNWKRINEIIFDPNVFFPSVDKDEEAVKNHKKEIIEQIGEREFDRLYENFEKQIQNYKNHEEKAKERIYEDEELSDQDKDLEFAAWQIQHSPYVYAEKVKEGSGGIIELAGEEIVMRGWKFTYEIPRRVNTKGFETNFYNKEFDKILNHEGNYKFYSYFIETLQKLNKFVPEREMDKIQTNGLPYIEKKAFEMFSESGLRAGAISIWDSIVDSTKSMDDSDINYQDKDVVSKKVERNLGIPYIKNSEDFVRDFIRAKILEYEVENKGLKPSVNQISKFRREANAEIAKQKSYNLDKVLKAYANLVITYKHKSRVEDWLKLGETILTQHKDIKESQVNPRNQTKRNFSDNSRDVKSVPDSFVNMKAMFDYYIDVFYGKTQSDERSATKNKVLNSREKKIKRKLEKAKQTLKDQYDRGELPKEDYNNKVHRIDTALDNLGSSPLWVRRANLVLKYVQLKGMGWNFFSAISNMGFGLMSNMIEAADGRMYNEEEMLWAYRTIMNTSVIRNYTFNKAPSKLGENIRKIMDEFDVLQDASNELFRTTSNSFSDKFRWLSPYNLQSRSEYINQSVLLLAMAKHQVVKRKDGSDGNFYEAMIKKGEWDTELYGEKDTELVDNFILKLKKIIKRNHGNYESLSPLMIKKTIVGRALAQFRTWLFEGWYNRTEGRIEDKTLDITRRGRYMTLTGLDKNDHVWKAAGGGVKGAFRVVGDVLKGSAIRILNIPIRTLTLNKYHLKNNDFKKYIGPGFDETDAGNMRKITAEFSMYLVIAGAMLMLKNMIADSDDDDGYLNFVYNHLMRLETDLVLYFNPEEADNLLKNPIPAATIINDIYDIGDAVYRLAKGDDEIPTGIYAGQSRTVKEVSTALPIGTQAYRLYSAKSKTFE